MRNMGRLNGSKRNRRRKVSQSQLFGEFASVVFIIAVAGVVVVVVVDRRHIGDLGDR